MRSRVAAKDEVRLSGAAIGETLLKTVAALGLDKTPCVGQGYDGASSMAGLFSLRHALHKSQYVKGC